MLFRALVELDLHLPRMAHERHVVIARRDPGLTGREDVARAAFAHPDLGLGREALGQMLGEHRRHVLHDDHRHGKIGRQNRENLGQGIGTAGGSADRHEVDALPKLRQRRRTDPNG